MKVEITEFEKIYSFNLLPITQLCGQNIIKKSYILESFRRHFSSYKYKEGQEKWINNIKIDGSFIGRKYFSILSIKNIDNIFNAIKCTKQSLMMEYLKQLIQNFELQKRMENIHVELDCIFQILNNDIHQLGAIELDYSMSDIWDILQKSDIYGENQTRLDNKSGYEIIVILLNLLEQKLSYTPQKQLIIFENIDHFLTKEEYVKIIKKIEMIVKKYDIYFIITTSLDEYVECEKDILSGITIFGDVNFQMPDFNDIKSFIIENYPWNKKISDEMIKILLEKIVQKIGRKSYLCSVEENVLCKMINQTLLLSESLNDEEIIPEKAFLKA